MRAHITVYLDDGIRLEGTAELRRKTGTGRRSPHTDFTPEARSGEKPQPDFSMPLRPFIKTHAAGLSGPKKLTLLLSHLTGGKPDVTVPLNEIEKRWSKMEALMGGRYNGAYSMRARDQGWVDSPKRGSLALRAGWEAILQ
ncbi:MAG: hypothetical protein JWN63_1099 [Candidatus Acidoferrum typicum]|nr:hypothetical protein [Candidatus Acidoferrum typicum]